MENPKLNEIQDWWNTKIIDIQPGIIRVRGYPIEQLIGSVSFPQMIWLMLRGELPSANQASLLEAAKLLRWIMGHKLRLYRWRAWP